MIVPTRDRPQFVAAAVGSVLRQTLRDVEVVLVDDGSGPDGAAAAAGLAEGDERVRLLRLEHSVGAAAARNRAMQVASGELVAFLDDDDEWAPETARAAVEHLRRHPGLIGVSSWHLVVPERGRAVVYRGPLEYDAADLLWCNFPAVPFAVIRREAAGEDLRFDEDLITCEDWDLFLRCARRRPMATLPEVLYRYHQRGAPRVTASNERRVDGYRRFMEKHSWDMSPTCRAYHEARVEILATRGLRRRARLAARLARSTPPAVAAVIARESVSARIGALTVDPGRSARTLLAGARRLSHGDRAPRGSR